MGIRNLHTFLHKTCPQIYNKVPLTKYAFKKIAIDLSIYMCKYKTTYGPNWLDAFVQLMVTLRKHDIHFVFVYDSKAPPEKDKERKSRSEARAKNKKRIDSICENWEAYKDTHEDLVLDDIQDAVLLQFVSKISQQKIDSKFFDIDVEIEKLKNSVFTISSDDFNMTKELFQLCEVPIVIAEGEAEATCALLNKKELVSAVLTDDTDVLAYRAPIMLHRIDFTDNTIVEIDYQEMLECLHISPASFLDFCIMCGTDYNTNIPKVGSDRSYKLIKQYESIDHLKSQFPNWSFDVLNYVRVREIFCFDHDTSPVPFVGFPDVDKVKLFFFNNNIKIPFDDFLNAFCTCRYHRFPDQEQENDSFTIKKKNLLLLI